MSEPVDPIARADAALAIELVGQFFATQIDAGAVLREEIVRHVQACAGAVASRHPEAAAHLEARAAEIAARLPAGWAEGDDGWVEPA